MIYCVVLYCSTGLTGIILTVIVIVMYVFAIPYARRNLFKAFWFTHSFYILLYLFLILHGSGRLVQAPLTQNFLIGPLVVYIFDKLISISRKKVELSVKKADLLPSGKNVLFTLKTQTVCVSRTMCVCIHTYRTYYLIWKSCYLYTLILTCGIRLDPNTFFPYLCLCKQNYQINFIHYIIRIHKLWLRTNCSLG